MTPGPGSGFPPRAVLLTGATGSLGGQICAELLNSTPAVVYCLVRAADEAAASRRIADRLARTDPAPEHGVGVIAIPGHLDQPGLGLSPEEYDALAETIDVIIHCAANVNLVADYASLAPSNLDGTRHLLDLARRSTVLTGRAPRFAFVSTLGVLAGARAAGLATVDEQTAASLDTAGEIGYTRTKAAAELEVRAAAAGGLPCTILRPGLVTGHSHTGRTSDSDLLTPLLRAAAALGVIPSAPGAMPGDTVDVIARATVDLAGRTDTAGHVYHLVRPQLLPLDAVFAALRRTGRRLDAVSGEEWWRRVAQADRDPEVSPLAILADTFRLYWVVTGSETRLPQVSSDATWKALGWPDKSIPPLDETFLDRLVAGLALPRPSARTVTATSAGNVASLRLRTDIRITPADLDDCSSRAVTMATGCETGGYGTFWVSEQRHDPILALAAATGATTTVGLGTAIMVAFARTPMTVAGIAHDLTMLSSGRFTLGLGPQVPAHIAHRFSMPAGHSAARMREFVAALRAIWGCWNEDKPLHFRGDFYTHILMPPEFRPPPSPYGPPPVFLAAVGPRMAELAGEIADGMIIHTFTTRSYIADVLIPAMERGLARSGRPRDAFTVVNTPWTITGHTAAERSRSEATARRQIAFFGSTTAYQPVLRRHGLDSFGAALTELSLSGDPACWDQMTGLVDDTILDLFAVAAPLNDLGPALDHRFAGLIDRLALAPLPAERMPDVSALWPG